MSLSQDEITAQIEQIRQNRLELTAESCGEITDLLCVFVHYAIEWREKLWEGVGIGLQEWQTSEKATRFQFPCFHLRLFYYFLRCQNALGLV